MKHPLPNDSDEMAPARLAPIRGVLDRLARDRRGNVLMIMGFAIIPLTFATGMGIDYSHAARLQTKLNAAADAAALAGVTQPMMKVTDENKVRDVADAMFRAQAETLTGLDGSPDVTVTLTHPDGPNSRVVNVTYTAKSINAFAGVLNMQAIAIGGSSSAKAISAPNMDFYIALDTSPSMALPTTSGGFQTMDTAVKCAFACHSNKIEQYVGSSLPSLILDNAKFSIIKGSYTSTGTGADEKQIIDGKGSYIYVNRTTANSTVDSKCNSGNKNICIYNADGSYVDSYWYALNKNVSLRVTDERNGVKDLMTLAQSYAAINNRTYRAALYTFDHSTNFKTISTFPSSLSAVSTAADSVDLVTVNDKAGNGRPPNGSAGSDYLFTSFNSLLTKMSTEILPSASGKGTDAPGDTPQGYLFMVTDGMSDEKSSIIGAPYSLGSDRTRSEMVKAHIDQCNAIKARGFKIAILYTQYTPESIKDDEPNQRDFVTANIPDVAAALTACASPDLMYTVKTDESISQALQVLFTKAVATARLTQ